MYIVQVLIDFLWCLMQVRLHKFLSQLNPDPHHPELRRIFLLRLRECCFGSSNKAAHSQIPLLCSSLLDKDCSSEGASFRWVGTLDSTHVLESPNSTGATKNELATAVSGMRRWCLRRASRHRGNKREVFVGRAAIPVRSSNVCGDCHGGENLSCGIGGDRASDWAGSVTIDLVINHGDNASSSGDLRNGSAVQLLLRSQSRCSDDGASLLDTISEGLRKGRA